MTMQYLERELRRTGDPRDSEAAGVIAGIRDARGSDIALPSVATPVEVKPIPQEYRPFTDQETKALIKDGAFILDLTTGNTIEDQEGAGRLFRYIYRGGGDRLLKLPSIITQVAIYPDPQKFFIPNSVNKNLSAQEKLAEIDGRDLRKRLGLKDEGVDVIIPEQASTLTEVTFKYLDETTKKGKGVWLFGEEYASFEGLNWVYGRTKNPVNESGSVVAFVGGAHPDYGVYVNFWDAGHGRGILRVVRLVVAKKK